MLASRVGICNLAIKLNCDGFEYCFMYMYGRNKKKLSGEH